MNTNLREWKSMMSFLVLTPLLLSLGQQAERRSDAAPMAVPSVIAAALAAAPQLALAQGAPFCLKNASGMLSCVSQHDFVRAGEAAQFGRSMRSAPAGRRDDGQFGGAARQPAAARHRARDSAFIARAVSDCKASRRLRSPQPRRHFITLRHARACRGHPRLLWAQ